MGRKSKGRTCRDFLRRRIGLAPKRQAGAGTSPAAPAAALAIGLALALAAEPAAARLLEWQAGRMIRKAGYWCQRVSDMRVIKNRSTDETLFVLVTCSGSDFAQYQVIIGRDNRVRSIEKF